jgi:hypothetical protein
MALRTHLERVLIVTDTWAPQVHGVVRSSAMTAQDLRGRGHEVAVIGPDRFVTMPCPTYPEVRLSLLPARRLARMIEAFMPCCLHLATEGPLGAAARSRGVDLACYNPESREDWEGQWGLKRPDFLHVGRVAVEKNIRTFLDLDLDLPGTKVIVGDGPQLAALRSAALGAERAACRRRAERFSWAAATYSVLQNLVPLRLNQGSS